MENTYNVKICFKGEGSFTFTLPKYGELTVYPHQNIFIRGLNIPGVELLRQLRPLMLEHQLNAKPDGCYKVIDLTRVQSPINKFERAIDTKTLETSLADLKAAMKRGPIVEDEVEIKEEIEAAVNEVIEEEPKEAIDPARHILTSTKHKGKMVCELTKGQISGNYAKFNEEDKAMVDLYKETLNK